MAWIRDEEFIRGNTPMTKFEVRVLSLVLLDVQQGDIFVDIGSGTGSIAVQAALFGAEVYAIEQNPNARELLQQNAEQFGVNISIIAGSAPEALTQVPEFTTSFLGGSGGRLQEILKTIDCRLQRGGSLVANFIKPQNMALCQKHLVDSGYLHIETRLIQIAQLDDQGLLRANNPVFILQGEKA